MNIFEWYRSLAGVARDLEAIGRTSRETLALVKVINRRTRIMAGELDALRTEVAETKTVIDSAIVFIAGLKAKLDEAIAAGDPAALTALAAELDAKQGELAAAIAENTAVGTDGFVLSE